MQHDLFKFFIDSVELTENPSGWDKFIITDRIDNDFKGLVKVSDTSIAFYADGYDILKGKYDSSGHCSESTFETRKYDYVAGFYKPIFIGTIQTKDIEFIEGDEGDYCKVQIKDNSFFARLYNNRDLDARVYVARSLNDVAITAAPYFQLRVFTPSTAGYIALQSTGVGQERNNTCFRVYDVLKFFIEYLSDGEIDFTSTDFADAGVYGGYVITNCHTLRMSTITGNSQELFQENWESFSFKDLLTELDKAFNIGFKMGFNGARPFIQIDAYESLFTDEVIHRFTDVQQVNIKTAKDKLIGKVEVGSELILDEPSLVSFPESLDLVGMKIESLAVAGCNEERVLNLVNGWIISSNMIEDMVVNGQTTAPTTYDGNICLIKATLNTTWYDADMSNWIGATPPEYYNEQLTNEKKLQRYLGALPASLVAYYSADTNRFRASLSSDNILGGFILTYNPQPFNDDFSGSNFDTGSNYDITPGAYNYITTVDKVFSFAAKIKVNVVQGGGTLTVWVQRWDAALLNRQGGVKMFEIVIPSIGYYEYDIIGTCYSAIGERLDCEVNYSIDGFAMLIATSYWECTNAGAGGNIATYDPNDTRLERIMFAAPLSFADYQTIDASPTKLIGVELKDVQRYGWMEERKYNPYEETCSFTLISKKNMRH